VCTAWGAILPVFFGFWPWSIVPVTWAYWMTGNLILIGVFTPIILHYLTIYIRRSS
jgi:hypothetical protein